MTQNEIFLVAMALILALPYGLWQLTGRAGWAPLVVVQIVVGILMGPGVLGALAPGLQGAVFTPGVTAMLSGIALWAVVLFIFLAGLELDLGAAWSEKGETFAVAGLALVVPMALGAAVGVVLVGQPGWVGPAAQDWQAVMALGMACAVTALPILVLFLTDLGLLRTPLGQRVLRYASLDDIAVWAVLAIILLDWDRVGRQAVFVALAIPAAWAVRAIIPRARAADRWPLALIWMVLAALGADWAGLHYTVGAFLAGAVLRADWFDRDQTDQLRHAVLLVLMPVFFLSTGLRTDWSFGGWTVALAAAALLAAAVAGKVGAMALAARLFRWPPGMGAQIGWLLQTKALITIVFANVLLDRGVLTAPAFTAILLMALGSTMLTIPVLRRLRDGT